MNLKLLLNTVRRNSINRMNTFYPAGVFKLDVDFDNCVNAAVKHIELGNVIAIPTDTVYGLAADAQNTEAVRKLYAIKSRKSSKPIAICVHKVEHIKSWGQADHLPEEMLRQLLPGPVTVVVNRTANLNANLNPGIEKVAIRIPKHKFVEQLTSMLKTPIALTSANKSNEMSSVSVDEFSYLWPLLDAVFDGGQIGRERCGSTIVDLSEPGKYEIIRKGSHVNETLQILAEYAIFEK